MSEVTIETEIKQQASASIGDGALRIVLFGMPDAGKTTLIGALAQAALRKNNALRATLADESGRLESLRHQVYENSAPMTQEEVVVYPVMFQPQSETENDGPRGLPVTEIVDCDGRVANEFLSQHRSLQNGKYGGLAQAILKADTLILAVDIASSTEVLNRNFNLLVKFLRMLEECRSEQNEVNGFPVYLVLTKCDLLAKPGDTLSEWMDRIEDRKRKVDEQFRGFLDKQARKKALPFGNISVHVWATAKQRPALGENAKAVKEPYQVAELFRQCLKSAGDYHQHRKKAHRVVWMVVLGVAALAGFMAIFAALFVLGRQGIGPEQLQTAINSAVRDIDPPDDADWEKAPEIVTMLDGFKNNGHYGQLAKSTQKTVDDLHTMFSSYVSYRSKVERILRRHNQLEEIDREADLQKLLKEMGGLFPPAKFSETFVKAPAGEKRQQCLNEAQAIADALERTKRAYKKVIDDGAQAVELQRKFKITEAVKLAKETWDHVLKLPHKTKNVVQLIPQSDSITWGVIFDYDIVQQQYEEWLRLERNIIKLKDIGMGP